MTIESPSDIEIWILRKIVFPLLIILLVYFFYGFFRKSQHCKELCEQKGYLKSEYFPSNRAGIGAYCLCTEKITPDGKVDKKAKLIIDLD